MTRESFDAAMKKLTTFYAGRGGERVTGMIADTWFANFKHQEASLFLGAIDRHIGTSKSDRMPTPGEIRETMEDLREIGYMSESRANNKGVSVPVSTSDLATNRSEWAANAAVTVLIMELHNIHHPMAVCNKDGSSTVVDMESWMMAGRPKTWSSLVDEYMNGLASVWPESSKMRVSYIEGYLKKLQNMKREQEAKTCKR